MDRNIPSIGTLRSTHKVALRKESVDRNILSVVAYSYYNVALRKESVDRNVTLSALAPKQNPVALRKESVDRNFDIRYTASTHPRSLSARRAWIEILSAMYAL